jgi:hypothetical protein
VNGWRQVRKVCQSLPVPARLGNWRSPTWPSTIGPWKGRGVAPRPERPTGAERGQW